MHVEIYLEFPEKNVGVHYLSSVISYNSKGEKIKDYQDLIDNTEFNYSDGSDVKSEIIDYVASKIGVSKEIIKIMDFEE